MKLSKKDFFVSAVLLSLSVTGYSGVSAANNITDNTSNTGSTIDYKVGKQASSEGSSSAKFSSSSSQSSQEISSGTAALSPKTSSSKSATTETQQQKTTGDEVNLFRPGTRSNLKPLPSMRSSLPTIYPTDKNRPAMDFIDISSNNGEISIDSFKKMRSYGITGVVVKLTEGSSYINPLAKSQVANAKAAGLKVSAYHYSWFTSNTNAVREADYFAKEAASIGLDKSTVMANDLEDPAIIGTADHTANCLAFQNELKRLGYQHVTHYVSKSLVQYGQINAQKFGNESFWVAQYLYDPTPGSQTAITNKFYGAWQWSPQLVVPDINGYFDISEDHTGMFTQIAHTYTTIISQKNVNYGGTITQSKRSDGLFSSGPYNTSATTLKPNASAKSYNGQKVAVSQEAITSNGVTWVKVKLTNDQSYWLDKRGIKVYNYTKIISQKNVNYGGTITQSKRSDGLFSSGPYNTSATTLKPNASAKSYNGQKVAVSQEAITSNGVTWVKVKLTNDQSYWLDKRGIKVYNYTKIISQKNVNYGGTITQSKRSDGLFSSGPYNTSAATLKPNVSAKSYNGQKVAVSQEAITSNGVTWVKVRLTNGQSYWLDKRGIKVYNYTKIISQKNVNYGGTITQSKRSDGLFSSGPYNTSAATLKPNASAKSYNGQKVAVSQEAITSNGVTWVKVRLTNGQSYWLDKRGIKVYNYTKIISQKNVNYGGTITQSKRSDGLFSSGPYNTSAATLKPNASAKSYNGQKVAVSQEAITSNGVTWVKVRLTNGQSYWLDKRGIKVYNYTKIISQKNVNYGGTITQSKRSDGLFSSGPYNTSAATLKPNASAKSYNGQKVAVSQEAITSNGVTWVKVRLTNGQSYWLDKRGIKVYNYTKIISQKNVNYGGTITQSKRSDGLFSSGPYNTSAATLKPNASAKSYNGQKVAVSQEAITSNGVTWVRIRLTNGQSYWLDKRGIK